MWLETQVTFVCGNRLLQCSLYKYVFKVNRLAWLLDSPTP